MGNKDQRSKLFSQVSFAIFLHVILSSIASLSLIMVIVIQEVCAMKFNVLVTTYEFIMYDRSKLSKVDWKYIIIDEAQRMKDRESVLARDLDRYRCQRRLLLTGTPLQVCQDIKQTTSHEIFLWEILNYLKVYNENVTSALG